MEVSNRKTTSKLAGSSLNYPPRPPRSPSPSKFSHPASANGTQEPFKPKARVNPSSVVRANKPSSIVSTSSKVTSASTTGARGREFPAPPAIRSTVSGSATKTSKPMLKGLHANLKPPGTQSVPTTPVNTAKASAPGFLNRDPSPAERRRSRTESMSLHRSVSISSLQGMKPRAGAPDLSPPSTVLSGADTGSSPAQGFKIKAKVTGIAKNLDLLSPHQANGHSPINPTRDLPRGRTASISSSSALSISSSPPQSPPQFYPITTGSPAANPHRYPTARIHHANVSQAAGSTQYQPFISASRSDHPQPQSQLRATANVLPVHAPKYSGSATPKVVARLSTSRRTSMEIDPATVPLPPHSPPTSTLSFSSRSSVSQSSASASYHTEHESDSTNPSTSTSGLRARTNSNHPREEMDEERKHRAEAKTNRKIADLEITNRSLLAINATLEKTKSKQAKEIRDLRRKLRETRLILPPRDYRRAMTSDDLGAKADDDSSLDESDSENDDDDDAGLDDDNGGEENGRRRTKLDEAYRRVQIMLQGLVDAGNSALKTEPEDFMDGVGRGGARVLSAEEQRTWRGEADEQDQNNDNGDGDDDVTRVPRLRDGAVSPASIMVPHSDDEGDGEVTSEEEVEALTLHQRSLTVSPSSTPGPPPPIRIFASP